MPSSTQNNRSASIDAIKSFNNGSVSAMPTTDLASGIYEAAAGIYGAPERPAPKKSQPEVKTSGGPLDRLATSGNGQEMEQKIGQDGSVRKKPKDTAGAGAMIL
ncbi:hypothetical protein F5B20DRAFT_586802 [Whalleya microplaca]|nr:hypothetical protein F5B20DRAFT_586802 [Whalleya microplaca]